MFSFKIHLAGEKTVQVKPKSEFFESPLRKAYYCQSDDSIEMTSSGPDPDKVVLEIDEIRIQPFLKYEVNGTFSEGK